MDSVNNQVSKLGKKATERPQNLRQPLKITFPQTFNMRKCPQQNTKYAAAAAAKLLQSCLTLCDPINGSPPGSSIPGIGLVKKFVQVLCKMLKTFLGIPITINRI